MIKPFTKICFRKKESVEKNYHIEEQKELLYIYVQCTYGSKKKGGCQTASKKR